MKKALIALALIATLVLLGCARPSPETITPPPTDDSIEILAAGTGNTQADVTDNDLDEISTMFNELNDSLNAFEEAEIKDSGIDESTFG